MTLTSLTTHKTKIFANPRVDLARRVSIFRATAFLTMTYNIGTWLQLTQSEQHAWCSGVMKVYRKLLSKLFSSDQQFTFDDGRVLAMTGLPHPDDLLHYERLRHFGLVLHRPNDVFWALVANEGTWLELVRESFTWLYQQIQGLTSLPDPGLFPEAWHSLIWNTPQRWKGILKRSLAHATGQREIQAYVKIFHKDFFQTLESAGLICPEEHVVQASDPHTCLLCNKTFTTFTAWAVHSFDAHQQGEQIQTTGHWFGMSCMWQRFCHKQPTCDAFSQQHTVCFDCGCPKIVDHTTALYGQYQCTLYYVGRLDETVDSNDF